MLSARQQSALSENVVDSNGSKTQDRVKRFAAAGAALFLDMRLPGSPTAPSSESLEGDVAAAWALLARALAADAFRLHDDAGEAPPAAVSFALADAGVQRGQASASMARLLCSQTCVQVLVALGRFDHQLPRPADLA